MKNEKVSVFVLAVEIAAIICLHSVKNEAAQIDPSSQLTKTTIPAPVRKKIDNQLTVPIYTVYQIRH